MKHYRYFLATLALALLFALPVYPQSLPDSLTRRIDSLFAFWNNPHSPGFAVGIIKGDSLIFSKGYGMADLEQDVPITDTTRFHVASVSKQFTAYQIVMLAREGKLRLDDDIRNLLPACHFDRKVTIRQLLHHTSGVRDQWQLLGIAGTRPDDIITQDQVLKVLSAQRGLNFPPGENFSYSNSGFTLLAQLVGKIDGCSFRKAADSVLFRPLGMDHSFFEDDYQELVPGLALSYEKKDGRYVRSILNYSTYGATGLKTNVRDLSRWIANFYDTRVGTAGDIAELTKKGRLNNGKEIDYASGINVTTYHGYREYSHGGNDAGYRAFISVFPDEQMGFIVLSNTAEANTEGMANHLADLFLPQPSSPSSADAKQHRPPGSAALPVRYLGYYISEEGYTFQLVRNADSLFYLVGPNRYYLVADTGNSYVMKDSRAVRFVFGKLAEIQVNMPGGDLHFTRYQPATPDGNALKAYAGAYYCPELDCIYHLVIRDKQLWLTNNKYPDAAITFAGRDHLLNNTSWMNHLVISHNKQGRIDGFEVNSGRVMHLRFNKLAVDSGII